VQQVSVSEDAPQAAPPGKEEQGLVDSPPATAEPPRAVVPRWVQLVVLPLGLVLVWVIATKAGKVLLLFVVAAIIALILNPAVALLQRRRLPRGLAVLAVYLAFFLTLAGIGVLLASPISKQARAFANNLPQIVNEANKHIADFERELNESGIHVHLKKPGKTALQTLQEKVGKSASKLASFGTSLLTEVANALFNLVLVFVISVYMLLYGQRIGAAARRVVPRGDGTPADDYPTLVQRAVSRYVFGQLLFSIIMGASAGLSLYVFGQLGIFPAGSKYAVVFGVLYAFFELVPYIGPILGAIGPVLVALFTKGPLTGLWVILLFIGLQQLEGHVVSPQVFGRTLRVNPLLVIFALLFGLDLYGIIGALIALPVLSVLRATVMYLRRHLTFEPWSDKSRPLL
jgi:predicted PurR-regulated permease PerM